MKTKALVARSKTCGCIMAMDIITDENHKAHMIHMGYVVSVVTLEEMHKLKESWVSPCEHEKLHSI